MKTKDFRKSERFLRSSFETSGPLGFPLVRKQRLDLSNVELIACSDTSAHDTLNLHRGVHFFVDDYRFESTYNRPEETLDRYKKYRFVLTPDFSLYAEMEPWRQIESVGKARWVGAFWQKNGLLVIPTMSWSSPSSFRFCFDAVEKHSIVAVSMIGCKRERTSFMRGYNAMLETVKPEGVICFGKPFPEMEGNLVVVDYLSSRKAARHGR